jgi:DNA-binding protein Fis
MKDYVKNQLELGKKYDEILESVKCEILNQMLILTHGNQSKAARILDVNRGTMRKWIKK